MRRLITGLSLCLTLSSQAQLGDYPLILPRDNGKTTSFCESLETGSSSKAYFDSVCIRLSELKDVHAAYRSSNEVVAYIHMNEMGHGVFAKVGIARCGKYVNYCFDDFRVDSYPIDEWITTASPVVAEQVKSRIFAKTIVIVAIIKNNITVASLR